MIWLLAEIGLSLILAAIAGWYIGWTLRGFRERDGVEDLRRTLRATEEVKDRELAEATRRAEAHEARSEQFERENERLRAEVSFGGDASARAGARGSERAQDAAAVGSGEAAPALLAALVHGEGTGPRESGGEEPDGRHNGERPARELELEEQLAQARARADDTSGVLRDKTAAVLALQAELGKLREGAEQRAGAIARLEHRVVELEPLEEKLATRTAELDEIRARLAEGRNDSDRAAGRVAELDAEVARLTEELARRDLRVNELRNRYQAANAELEELRARYQRLQSQAVPVAALDAAGQGELDAARAKIARLKEDAAAAAGDATAARSLRDDLAEARRMLQRQIDRNRKQDTVHRQVVASLQEEVESLRAGAGSSAVHEDKRAPGTSDATWHQLVAERDSRIMALRERVVEMERQQSTTPIRRDDLRRIRGVGPKLSRQLNELGVYTFDQIAAWDDAEIDRITEAIGDQTDRIRNDRWVRSAYEFAHQATHDS